MAQRNVPRSRTALGRLIVSNHRAPPGMPRRLLKGHDRARQRAHPGGISARHHRAPRLERYLPPPPTNTPPNRRTYSHSEYNVSATATYMVTTPTIPLKTAKAFHAPPPHA